MPETIKERFEEVNEKIHLACLESARNDADVNLIVVTKWQPVEKIIEVCEAGASLLGENYPEETVDKIKILNGRAKPEWHMIGHLQSRKTKLLYPDFSMIHSVDSLEIAEKINRLFEEKNTVFDALIEVNIAGEASKNGFQAEDVKKRDDFIKTFEKLLELKHIKWCGLMTMPPYAFSKEQNKACYNLCRELQVSLKEKFHLDSFTQLSMGTSSDFETGVKCGATFVRVGEAIMGKRIYTTEKQGL
jgi:PLP dependent protein